MLVILKESVENLGKVGDLVKVSGGYARNFLIPNNLVIPADEKNIARVEHVKKSLEKKRLALRAASEELSKKLTELTLTFKRKVGEKEKLFGSVTASDVYEAVIQKGFTIEKRMVQLSAPLRNLGQSLVTLKLDTDAVAQVKVVIEKE